MFNPTFIQSQVPKNRPTDMIEKMNQVINMGFSTQKAAVDYFMANTENHQKAVVAYQYAIQGAK